MSTNTLLSPPDPFNLSAWQFDHAMAHRANIGAMSRPIGVNHIGGVFYPSPATGGLAEFSGVPYFIDPMNNGGFWHFDHEQAHRDYMLTLPAAYGHTGLGTMSPTQNFGEMDFAEPDMMRWWVFANHQQHYIASTVIVATMNRFPFW